MKINKAKSRLQPVVFDDIPPGSVFRIQDDLYMKVQVDCDVFIAASLEDGNRWMDMNTSAYEGLWVTPVDAELTVYDKTTE